MASTKEYKDFILEQLRLLDNIEYRPMMGEYVLYYKGVIVGGIYDDRFLVKKTTKNSMYNMKEAIPYEKGKTMYLVEEIDNIDILKSIVMDTYEDLKK